MEVRYVATVVLLKSLHTWPGNAGLHIQSPVYVLLLKAVLKRPWLCIVLREENVIYHF